MKIVIGSDHRGFKHKQFIMQNMPSYDWLDIGAFDDQRSDFPVFVEKACGAILSKQAEGGVLLCGSGVGMSIMANRFSHIYAALVWNDQVAQKAKEHNNANVLVLPADFVTEQQSVSMIQTWLAASPLNGRYKQRIKMIDNIGGVTL